MRLLDAILRRPARVPRLVHVYASSDDTIVAAMHRNFAGIYYEQADPIVLAGPADAEALGSAFKRAFDRFRVKDVNLREHKRSDWPAYRASGLRTIKEFESRYRFVSCSSADATNRLVHASFEPTGAAGHMIEFAADAPATVIGERIAHLLERACTA